MQKTLFISYDGLTDPLGQSQILPYMLGLAHAGYKVYILSCEKLERFKKFSSLIAEICSKNNITWEYTFFTQKPPILAKLFDFYQLRKKAVQIMWREQLDIVHCRSYVAAEIGLYLKGKYKCKFIFDMRGFWADERKDSGAWDVQKPLYRYLYNRYKEKEQNFILNADYIISLTLAGKTEVLNWKYCKQQQLKIQVIPCCADMQHFSLTSAGAKQASRNRLGVADDDFVISYLGSIGTWYMLDEMLQLYVLVKKKYPKTKFLFITHSAPELILAKLNTYQLDTTEIIIQSASREEVPSLIKASDINVSFIKPSYSKIASSPTKNAEVLAMGIPIIFNAKVGDSQELANLKVGYMLDDFSQEALSLAVASIESLVAISPIFIRNQAEQKFSLQTGINSYLTVYNSLN